MDSEVGEEGNDILQKLSRSLQAYQPSTDSMQYYADVMLDGQKPDTSSTKRQSRKKLTERTRQLLDFVRVASYVTGVCFCVFGCFCELFHFHQAIELFTGMIGTATVCMSVVVLTRYALTRDRFSGRSLKPSVPLVLAEMITLALEFSCILGGTVFRSRLIHNCEAELRDSLSLIALGGSGHWINNVQMDLDCCGITSYADWPSNALTNSCCKVYGCIEKTSSGPFPFPIPGAALDPVVLPTSNAISPPAPSPDAALQPPLHQMPNQDGTETAPAIPGLVPPAPPSPPAPPVNPVEPPSLYKPVGCLKRFQDLMDTEADRFVHASCALFLLQTISSLLLVLIELFQHNYNTSS